MQDEEEKRKLEEAKAKKAANNRKKNEKKRAKAKAAAEAKTVAETDQAQNSSESSSESETDSPVKASSARMARVGMGTAKRAILTLEEELLNMSDGQREEFGDSVFKALSVKTARATNSPIFRAEVFNSRTSTRGQEEELCADTGCTKPIVGSLICKEQRIPIRPLSSSMVITDASGNRLNIVCTVTFYIRSSQVLGSRMRRVKAAVLEGNEIDREILISLELLVSWDLVTPTFPQETVTNYFIRKNKEKNKHQFFQSAHTAKTSKVVYERKGLFHKLRAPSNQKV